MTNIEETYKQYWGRSVLLDSNLLLLWLIGTFQRERITAFKRTANFTLQEFDCLTSLLSQFRGIVTTPHILTEVNSLANSLPEYLKPEWSNHFAVQTTTFLEVLHSATEIMREVAFASFGLSDAAIYNAASNTLVLTEDYRLSGYLQSAGVAVLNFRDLASYL